MNILDIRNIENNSKLLIETTIAIRDQGGQIHLSSH